MSMKKFAKREGLDTAIYYKGQFVGKISINTINWALKKCEIGYFLDESFQGEGIMTRAAKGMIDIAFKEYKLQKVEINAAVGNKKSRHIAERLGFINAGTIRNAEWLYDHYVDHAVYGLLKVDVVEWEIAGTSQSELTRNLKEKGWYGRKVDHITNISK